MLALGLEIVSYAIAGWLLILLRGDNPSLGWVTNARVALVMWGLGSLLPVAPAEGIALSASELERRGVQPEHAVTMLLLAGWLQLWALVITAAVTSAVVATVAHPDPDDAIRLLVVACVLSGITLIVVALVRRPFVGKLAADAIRWLPRHRKKTRSPRCARPASTSTRVCSDSSGDRFIGSGSRWRPPVGGSPTREFCGSRCTPRTRHVDFGLVVLAYVAGILASWVPLLPGGLGAVEIAVPGGAAPLRGATGHRAHRNTAVAAGSRSSCPRSVARLAYGSLRAQPV